MGWAESALVRLLVALAVGLLIGLDRERAEARKARRLFAGIRTFPLIALAGAVPTLLLPETGVVFLVVSFMAVAGVALVAYIRGSAGGHLGATTEMAALTTFLLGCLAGAGHLVVAAATAVAVAVLLVAKPRLERFSRRLSHEELSAALELAVVSVIVLPVVPNHGYGPWGVLNPFDIWLVVVLVSGLSFAGFIAVRLFGEDRGMLMAGAIGALVSSTAVTVAMATNSRHAPQSGATAAAAAVLASSVMCLRVAVFAGLVNAAVLPRLLPVVAIMALEGVACAVFLQRGASRSVTGRRESAVANPSSLTAAVVFALIYACILLMVRAAHEQLGPGGIYLASALSSLADVDAVAIALTNLGGSTGNWQAAALAVSIAMVSNTLVKLGISVALGRGSFRSSVAWSLAGMSLVGAVGAMATAYGF